MFRFRAIPWILVLAAIKVLWDHWNRVEEQDRARAARILADSKGMPQRMSPRERSELVDIARRVDAIALGRDLAATAAPFKVPGLKTKQPDKKKR
jgi:hypothetical protein